MIPYAYESLFFADSTQKDLLITDGTVTVSGTNYSVAGATVTITNSILETESFTLHQSLCSATQIQFGSCESNSISFTMHDNVPTLKGKVLKVYIIPNHDASKMLQIGVFKVQEDKLTADRTKRNITAYDALYDVLNSDVAAWYNTELPNSSTTKTLAQFRADFLSHFSITVETTTLANDSMTVKRTIDPETLSGADVIRAICEINGVFGTITNEGKFRFVELVANIDDALFPDNALYPRNDLYPRDFQSVVKPIDKAYYIEADYEDWFSEDITQLTITTNVKNVSATVGTAGNTYVIQNNLLLDGKSIVELTTIATNTLTKMVNRHYQPGTVNAVGNPCHEVGDPILIHTTYGDVFTYVLQRNLIGIQGLRDTYTALGERYFDFDLNSVQSQLKARVEKDNIVYDLDGKMDNSITITPSQIKFQGAGALVVDTTNFTLDADGNATFTGTVSGSTISGSSLVSNGSDDSQVLIDEGMIRVTNEGSIAYDHADLKYDELYIGSDIQAASYQSDGIWMGNNHFVPTTVTIGGTNYKILAMQL